MSANVGRVAVVTGAGSGIGRALALALAARGARVALADLDADAVAETGRRCRQLGARVRTDVVDVTDRRAVAEYPAAVLAEYGRVDAVFAVAGVIHVGALLDSDLVDVEHVFDVNVRGVVWTAKAFLPHLVASGDGRLVTVSSAFGLAAMPYYSAYSASKAAVRAFTAALRQELAADGHPVAVTCAVPGGVRTPIMRRGRYAPSEDPAAVAEAFDRRIARTDAGAAAEVILHGAERRRAQVLVGPDARLVSWLARLVGSSYQNLLPRLLRAGLLRR
ncbi:SDR family NAD(P)-dependent oxidoreductase [Saccharothrix hoggarensis]|uniref:SDR family NAD(P)-dependent oxidoreductase n=1 Tax=Saccharothrix hoggarensis TaxID=913853 RepID=A0ABW3R205_9PSEU